MALPAIKMSPTPSNNHAGMDLRRQVFETVDTLSAGVSDKASTSRPPSANCQMREGIR